MQIVKNINIRAAASVTQAVKSMIFINDVLIFSEMLRYLRCLEDQSPYYSDVHISVSFIGYPNVVKSSFTNTLREKKVCKTAPVVREIEVRNSFG